MSTADAGGRKRKPAQKTPFWKKQIGKKGLTGEDEVVEHPPFVATLPRANLLPISVRNAIGVRKARRGLIWAAVLLVAVFAGLWFMQSTRISEAEADVARATAEGKALQTKVDALDAVSEFSTQLTSQGEIVTATLADQPLAAQVMKQLAEAGAAASESGEPVTFANVGVGYEGIPAAGGPFNPCPNPDPFGTELTIGCVSFTATAKSPYQVSKVLEVLEADPMFVGPYVTNTQLGDLAAGDAKAQTIIFNGTAGVSLAGLQTPLTSEQVDAIVNPPKPAEDDEKAAADEAESAS